MNHTFHTKTTGNDFVSFLATSPINFALRCSVHGNWSIYCHLSDIFAYAKYRNESGGSFIHTFCQNSTVVFHSSLSGWPPFPLLHVCVIVVDRLHVRSSGAVSLRTRPWSVWVRNIGILYGLLGAELLIMLVLLSLLLLCNTVWSTVHDHNDVLLSLLGSRCHPERQDRAPSRIPDTMLDVVSDGAPCKQHVLKVTTLHKSQALKQQATLLAVGLVWKRRWPSSRARGNTGNSGVIVILRLESM